MNMYKALVVSAATLAPLVTTSFGQVVEVQYDAPSLDRWNYPFNGSPGTRFDMTSFGAIEQPGFDDHDAQVLLGFDTFNDITSGLGAQEYRVLSATVTMTMSNNNDFRYDPTHDALETYGALGEPFDLDLGRPINLWLTGYRDGLDQTTYTETTLFGLTPDVFPAQGLRSAFAAVFDNAGSATDISNNLKEQFEAFPLAIGQTDAVAPGSLVPADSTFSFTFTPCQLGEHMELGKMLDLGQVRFSISSLQSASGSPDGGGGVNYPIWYARENPLSQILGFAPTLTLKVRIGSSGDYNGDGNRNFLDVSEFLSDFGAGDPNADINGDCSFNFLDVSQFLSEFANG
ncbi:MAG: GC-type dockerin domain-anchored protein [Phycisphaerales bacterium]